MNESLDETLHDAAMEEVRSDALMFTGRSDYPNQVNNVLCFPFIFRGASMWAPQPSMKR